MTRIVPDNARLEIKFNGHELEKDRIRQWLKMHPACFYTPYPDRWINNVYFDTHHYHCYAENLSGGSARTKLRYRWYGQHDYPQKGVLEVKCKRNYFGWKLRFNADKSPYEKEGGWRDIQHNLIEMLAPEARIWLESHPQPVIINRYYRMYFVSKDEKVRATIDIKQRMFDQRYKPYPNISRAVNSPKTLVLEIKFDRKDTAIASKIMQGLPLRVSRNSKYMIGVKSIHGF